MLPVLLESEAPSEVLPTMIYNNMTRVWTRQRKNTTGTDEGEIGELSESRPCVGRARDDAECRMRGATKPPWHPS